MLKIKKRIKFDDTLPKEIFAKKRGCFVSIHKKDGQLRGCIGTIFPIYKILLKKYKKMLLLPPLGS